MTKIRSPICVVVGHVDHGKSSILDWIRKTAVVKSEKGAITQAIGASIVPLETIKRIAGTLMEQMKASISGLLFIDTPGHAAFTNLRRRGGSLADIAIICVDVNEGFKPQTVEALEILQQFKVPFVVAANKIDLLHGWQQSGKLLIENISSQSEQVQQKLDRKLYELVGRISEFNIQAERFDRVDDFTKQIAIIPTSAKTGEGLPELLMVITGLAQRYLEQCLKCDPDGPAKGTILEVKEQKGLGCCLDAIIYDGKLRVDDTIVVGTMGEPAVTKVRGLFEPAINMEMRDAKSKFLSVREVRAATGVRISAPCLEGVIPGMPLRGATDNIEQLKQEIAKEISEVLIETDQLGIVIKADSLGSLEALIKLLRERKIRIKKASIGDIMKKDILDAEVNLEKEPLLAVVIGFNIKTPHEAETLAAEKNIRIINDPVIYKVIEDLEAWQETRKKELEAGKLDQLVRPCKIELMRDYIFRQSNPAILGVEILVGTLKTGMPLMKEGKPMTVVRALQHEKESISSAQKGKQVAASLDKVTIGRQINPGDMLFSAIPEKDFLALKKMKSYLSKEELGVMKEIAEMMRRENPVWGI